MACVRSSKAIGDQLLLIGKYSGEFKLLFGIYQSIHEEVYSSKFNVK